MLCHRLEVCVEGRQNLADGCAWCMCLGGGQPREVRHLVTIEDVLIKPGQKGLSPAWGHQ